MNNKEILYICIGVVAVLVIIFVILELTKKKKKKNTASSFMASASSPQLNLTPLNPSNNSVSLVDSNQNVYMLSSTSGQGIPLWFNNPANTFIVTLSMNQPTDNSQYMYSMSASPNNISLADADSGVQCSLSLATSGKVIPTAWNSLQSAAMNGSVYLAQVPLLN